MQDPGKITPDRLKDLGLYTSYDVSKWCARNGIQSVYLEHVRVKLNRLRFTHQSLLDYGYWAVRDSQQPGKNLLKILPRGKNPHLNARAIGTAWIEEHYDTPTTYVNSLRACLPTPAVEMLEDELRLQSRIWSPVETERVLVPNGIKQRFLEDYPVVPRSLAEIAAKELVMI